ncbi:speedy protein 1-A-like [Hyperolius riggenbachi]|uniref:speedy protein 1-A-like n=1 Tax=Hyperolius riggenbachi TaxID=752182 RepID=UPI0035A2A625
MGAAGRKPEAHRSCACGDLKTEQRGSSEFRTAKFRTGGEDACPPERSRKRPAPNDTEERPEKRWAKWASQQQQPVEPEVWAAFCEILEDDCIQRFLSRDRCLRISDKYQVLVYFVRAGLRREEFKGHFFAALFLANQVEEDASYYRQNIYPWALGCMWEENKDKLHRCRDDLLRRMKHQARVSRKMCDQVPDSCHAHSVTPSHSMSASGEDDAPPPARKTLESLSWIHKVAPICICFFA